MKLFKAVLALAFAALAAARVDIEFDNTKVKPGKTYEVEWQSDQEYVRLDFIHPHLLIFVS